MTVKQAHKRAVQLLGARARVEVRPNGGRIGHHGEFVKLSQMWGIGKGSSAHERRFNRYRCAACSTATVDETGDLIERDVYHKAGGQHIAYVVGFVDSFLGAFHIRAEGGSWAECFAQLEAKRDRQAS